MYRRRIAFRWGEPSAQAQGSARTCVINEELLGNRDVATAIYKKHQQNLSEEKPSPYVKKLKAAARSEAKQERELSLLEKNATYASMAASGLSGAGRVPVCCPVLGPVRAAGTFARRRFYFSERVLVAGGSPHQRISSSCT